MVATAPQLYPDLARLGCVKTILNLLNHENTDIASAAIELLQEVGSLRRVLVFWEAISQLGV